MDVFWSRLTEESGMSSKQRWVLLNNLLGFWRIPLVLACLSWNPRYPAAVTIFIWLASQRMITARASGHFDRDSSSFDNFLFYCKQVQFPRLTFSVSFICLFMCCLLSLFSCFVVKCPQVWINELSLPALLIPMLKDQAGSIMYTPTSLYYGSELCQWSISNSAWFQLFINVTQSCLPLQS